VGNYKRNVGVNKLRFRLTPLPHPFAGDETVRLEAWGRLDIVLEKTEEALDLFNLEWNLDDLAEWFADHKEAIATEPFPTGAANCALGAEESLADALERCSEWSSELPEDESLRRLAVLQDYAHRHSLQFALHGIQMPPVLVGCIRGGGEISLGHAEWYPAIEAWAYDFDMEDFCLHLTEELKLFLLAWRATSDEPDVVERANSILIRLDA
jgi:hypothetical protein